MKGCVYVLTNEAMPDLVKVGYSLKDPSIRARELRNTGNPKDYVVQYEILVENPRRVESAVHSRLQNKREGREWFRCSVERAVDEIRQTASENIVYEDFVKLEKDKVLALEAKRQAEVEKRT